MTELGQINLDCDFGKELYDLAKEDHIFTIVEIGTWNGCGSTNCLARGVIDSQRQDKEIISLEANRSMFEKAIEIHKNNNFCKIIHGRIVDVDEIPFKDLPSPKDQWLRDDIKAMNSCPNVLSQLPQQIDLLLLDGGEFTSYVEYQKLKDRVSTYIALDDTKELKNCKVVAELMKDSNFNCIYMSLSRNGCSIFKRK